MPLSFIAITQRIVENDSYKEHRETLSTEWGELFRTRLHSFLPLPLSYAIPFSHYKDALEGKLAAVILSGGGDLNSINPSQHAKMRDDYEREIIQLCLKESLPLLGICRGAQMIAEFFDATIIKLDGHIGNHKVIMQDNSEFITNSYHNYGLKSLPNALRPLATAQDGSIEAFCHKNAKIYAIMWHIERDGGLGDNGALLQQFCDMILT